MPVDKKKKARAWKVFADYIKLRDTNGDWVPCISCNKPIRYGSSDCQAGHYYNRNYSALYHDEKNVNAQCKSCNLFKEGNKQGYQKGLIKKYGVEVLNDLSIRSHNFLKMNNAYYDLIIIEYTQKIKTLKALRN